MKTRRIILLVVLLVVLLTIVSGLVVAGRRRAAQDNSIPTFATAVEGVQIISAQVVPGLAAPELSDLEVQVSNSTDKGIKFLVLSNGTGGHGSGDDVVVLAPHGMFTMRYPVANLQQGKPLVVSAVVWEDGTTAGYPLQAQHAKKAVDAFAAKEGGRQ